MSNIRLAAPHFQDFDLTPDPISPEFTMLNWHDTKSKYTFGPHQISDGLLRIMARTTLFLLPKESLPSVLIIDEPELGLHPYAINMLGSLIRKVSNRCQVILATQSINLLDQFVAEDIIAVTRDGGGSNYKRLNSKDIRDWLEEYTISQIWEKNIIGGRPTR